MGQKARVDTIILIILLMLSLIGALSGFYYFQKERLKVFALNEELENLKAEKRVAEAKLTESKRMIDELNAQLKTARSQIKELNIELEQAKSEKSQLYSQTEELQLQIQEQEKIGKEWEAKQIQAQEKIDKLQALLKTVQTDKERLEAELDKLEAKGEVALGKIVVGQKKTDEEEPGAVEEELAGETPSVALAQHQAVPASEGKVLVINKDYDFVVINLGSRDGVNLDDAFSVYHNDSYIGDIQVAKITEIMSACVFVSGEIKDKISEGDKAIRK